MIAKGVMHRQGTTLARYLVTAKAGEYAALWELRGFACTTIVPAFQSIHIMAAATKCLAPFFHVALRNRDDEVLDRAQWQYAADRIERILGLTDQPRAIAAHTCKETGQTHVHLAWSRIDNETLKAKPLPYFKLRLKQACRELENRLGLAPVANDRDTAIEFAPKRAEEEQARRLGLDVHKVREAIRRCFENSDCGQSFKAALAQERLTLVRGDRRDYLALDRGAGIHALGKRLLGVSAAEIRQRFADLSRDHLPTLDEARKLQIGQQEKELDLPEPWHRPVNVNLSDQTAPEPQSGSSDTVSDENAPGHQPVSNSKNELEALAPALPPRVQTITQNETTTLEKPAPDPTGDRKLGDRLRGLFRTAMKALTGRPEPTPRRKKQRTGVGEMVAAFRRVARAIVQPVSHLPMISHMPGFLQDGLSWLHLWVCDDEGNECDVAGPDGIENEDLSLRL